MKPRVSRYRQYDRDLLRLFDEGILDGCRFEIARGSLNATHKIFNAKRRLDLPYQTVRDRIIRLYGRRDYVTLLKSPDFETVLKDLYLRGLFEGKLYPNAIGNAKQTCAVLNENGIRISFSTVINRLKKLNIYKSRAA